MIDYQKICNNLLKDLPKRTIDVIERRFGLRKKERETLETIGEDYGVTRERVRQIENEGLLKIKPKFKKHSEVIKFFRKKLNSFGGIKREDLFLLSLGEEKKHNLILFLLFLTPGFNRFAETDKFHCFWSNKENPFENIKKITQLTIKKLKKEKKTFSFEELFFILKKDLSKSLKNINKKIFESYLELSKDLGQNLEKEWGLKDWIEINPRGIKDKAYLVLKKHGQPLHFKKVAQLIGEFSFSEKKQAHVATVHNELIKDDRFVLVGRGFYALREWGYTPGFVKEIILKILKDSKKPLTKEEIIEKVLEQRIVKKTTVLLNLQDKKYFIKDSNGRYIVREA